MRPSRCTKLKKPRRNFRGNLLCFALKATAALANRTSPLIRVRSFGSKVCAQCVFLVRAHAAKMSVSAGSTEASREDANKIVGGHVLLIDPLVVGRRIALPSDQVL